MPFREEGGWCGHVAGFDGVRLEGEPTGFNGKRETACHDDRIASLGDGGVDEHGVIAQLHCCRCMGRHADACIDDKRNVGEMRPHGFERIRIVQAAARADGRAPRHQHFATGFEKLFRDDQIVIHIGKDLETVVA